MKIVYFDNFRGFESIFLPLLDVNFFVGENSTGKTSVLKLIGIISSPGFWNYSEFNNKLFDLGSFSEIITSGSSKEFFEIGICENDETNIIAIKLQFIEENNIPSLKEICFLNSVANVQITIEGSLIKYRYNFELESNIEDSQVVFKNWISNNGLKDIPFERVSLNYLGINSMLFQLQSIIALTNETSQKYEISFTNYFPSFFKNLTWSEPTRTEALKTYDSYQTSFSPNGAHAPYLLKDVLKDELKSYIINRFGEDSGLFDKIEINFLGDTNKPTSPFEILVTLNDKQVNLANVGYGVAQILPILLEVITRPKNTWFAIQQPEVHLHPRAQAAFGDFIFKSNVEDFQRFVIETHSDYIIDRLRLRMNRAQNDEKLSSVILKTQVIFFNRNGNGNTISILRINPDGSYPEEQPEGFRDFFVNEQFDLITI